MLLMKSELYYVYGKHFKMQIELILSFSITDSSLKLSVKF